MGQPCRKVLTGAMEPKAVDMILQELFHPNHMVGDNNTGPQVVLMELSDFLPSQALFEDVIKRHPRQSVTYYRGQGHGPVNVEVSQGSRKQGAAEARTAHALPPYHHHGLGHFVAVRLGLVAYRQGRWVCSSDGSWHEERIFGFVEQVGVV